MEIGANGLNIASLHTAGGTQLLAVRERTGAAQPGRLIVAHVWRHAKTYLVDPI